MTKHEEFSAELTKKMVKADEEMLKLEYQHAKEEMCAFNDRLYDFLMNDPWDDMRSQAHITMIAGISGLKECGHSPEEIILMARIAIEKEFNDSDVNF